MKKNIVNITAAALILLAVTTVHTEQFSAQQGDLWLGGNFEFMSAGVSIKDSDYDIPRQNLIALSPIIRLFPANNFTLGPKLSWTGIFMDDDNLNIWGLGAELGYVHQSSSHPYILVSPHFSIINGNAEDTENMFMLPITAGIMASVGGNLGLQFELGYSMGFHEDFSTNTLSIGIGVCGLGEKLAVSMVNVLSALSSMN